LRFAFTLQIVAAGDRAHCLLGLLPIRSCRLP
jgi:hypothetical protein